VLELVEETFECECELFVEFTALLSWKAGASIDWHHDANRDYLEVRDMLDVLRESGARRKERWLLLLDAIIESHDAFHHRGSSPFLDERTPHTPLCLRIRRIDAACVRMTHLRFDASTHQACGPRGGGRGRS
jgi:hypothetical protein